MSNLQTARSPQRDTGNALIAADSATSALRELGSRAHQLRAATRAADHFSGMNADADRSTGSWLMSCAVGLASELAADIDSLARALRDNPPDAALQQAVSAARVRAHQLHAAARAADHFLEQESHEDRETGSWLIACALGLAVKLAAELDDSVPPTRRTAIDKLRIEPHDAQLVRSMAAAMPGTHTG
ncbi:MAG: hypothetical protein H7Z19_15495 [Chitinophagaceae bacterium]|nr:hypothetical protein [Rubrivivax sp.]